VSAIRSPQSKGFTMPAYVVAFVNVTDPEPMGRYAESVLAVTERYGGRYLFSGPGAEVLEGDWRPDGMAIIEFPTREDAQRWYDSPEYAPLRALRQSVGPTGLLLTPDVNDVS
jgi:uncharacterized protein (DUF1330 family)